MNPENQNTNSGPQVITPNPVNNSGVQNPQPGVNPEQTNVQPDVQEPASADTSLQDLESPDTQALDSSAQASASPVYNAATPATQPINATPPQTKKRNLLTKTLVFSSIILASIFLVAVVVAFIGRNNDAGNVAEIIPEQSIDVGSQSDTELFDVSVADNQNKLIVNGTLVSTNSIVVSNGAGNGFGQFSAAGLDGSFTYQLPSESGEVCLDSNNCDFLTGTQLAGTIEELEAGAGITINNNIVSVSRTVVTNDSGFIQGGNSFGATAILGTNDNKNLKLETNGATRLTLDTNGNLSFADYVQISADGVSTPFIQAGKLLGVPILGITAYTTAVTTETDNPQAFIIQDSSYNKVLTVDTANQRVIIGNSSGFVPSIFRIDNTLDVGGGTCAFGCWAQSTTGTLSGTGPTISNFGGQRINWGTADGDSFVLGSGYGLWINTPSIGTGTSITNATGLLVQPITGASNNYGVRIGTASTQTLQVGYDANGTTANAGIAFGSSRDTNLYRGAVNQLNTDDALDVAGHVAIGNNASVSSTNTVNINENYVTDQEGIEAVNVVTNWNPSDNDCGFFDCSGTGIVNQFTFAGDQDAFINAAIQNSITHSSSGYAGVVVSEFGGAEITAGSTDLLVATYLTASTGASSTINPGGAIAGAIYEVNNASSGTVDLATGLNTVINNGSGTLSEANGLLIQSATNGGTLTDNYGIRVDDQTAGTNDYGIAIAGADTYALWLGSGADNTDAANGITFGQSGDTNLYRSAANTLATNDSLAVSQKIQVGDEVGSTSQCNLLFVAYINCNAFVEVADVSTETSNNTYGIRNSVQLNPGSDNSAANVGIENNLVLNGTGINYTNLNVGSKGAVTVNTTGTVAYAVGGTFSIANSAAGNISQSAALLAGISNTSTGTVGEGVGLWVQSAVNSGGGTYTDNYGIRVDDQTAGTNDYGIAIAGADTYALWLGSGADNTDAANGITFGQSGDTNIYRGAANQLKTDDALQVATTSANALQVTDGFDSFFNVNTNINSATIGGYNTDNSVDSSFILGYDNEFATGHSSNYIVGEGNYIDTDNAYAFGYYNTVTGNTGFAYGDGNEVSGLGAWALGANNVSEGNRSGALGVDLESSATRSLALGQEIRINSSANGTVAIGLDGTTRNVTQANSFVVMGGNSGFGVLSPAHKLDVYSDQTGDDPTYVANLFHDWDDQQAYGVRIQAGADDASGTTVYLDAYDGDGDQVGYIANTSGTFALTDISDARTKTNISDTSVQGLDVINSLRVADYNRIQNPNGSQITGFIAQEVQDVYSQAVSVGPDGLLGIQKDAFIPVLIKGVQEQQAQIDEANSRIATLESALTNLNQTQGANSLPNKLNVTSVTASTASVTTLTVRGTATFEGDIKVAGDLDLAGKVLGNELTRGDVTVKKGETEVEYTFSDAFEVKPNIVLTATNSFAPQYRVEATKRGFTLYLAQPANEDITLNYQAQQ